MVFNTARLTGAGTVNANNQLQKSKPVNRSIVFFSGSST